MRIKAYVYSSETLTRLRHLHLRGRLRADARNTEPLFAASGIALLERGGRPPYLHVLLRDVRQHFPVLAGGDAASDDPYSRDWPVQRLPLAKHAGFRSQEGHCRPRTSA